MQSVNKEQIQQQGCWLEGKEDGAKRASKNPRIGEKPGAFGLGYDELNLAEFPLAVIADRHPSGKKTTILTDTAWDRSAKKRLPRQLMISGSDLYGLPTAKDDDVLLACIQLSSIRGFDVAEVFFSRYELLKLLRWNDSSRNYRRLATSLRRWLGVTIYSSRAFFDHANKSWVNRDFGLFDNLNIYEREKDNRGFRLRRSSWRWNEVVLDSLQSGYLKRLDWEFYCALSSPVAKRLYRFLDKRFYHGDLVINLEDLAIHKLRLSDNYNTSQIKRVLRKGIKELETKWDLVPMSAKERFQKKGLGNWEVVFKRKRRPKLNRITDSTKIQKRDGEPPMVTELTSRGVGLTVAKELASHQDPKRVINTIELFDWYNSRGNQKQPGFIVAGIRSVEPYVEPPGFENSTTRAARKQASDSRNRRERKTRQQADQSRISEEKRSWEPFWDYWNSLELAEQAEHKQRALQGADPVKRDGYQRNMEGELGKQYLHTILRDYFEQTQSASG